VSSHVLTQPKIIAKDDKFVKITQGSIARSGSLIRFRAYAKRTLSELYNQGDGDDDGNDSLEEEDESQLSDGKDLVEQPQKRHIASLARSGWLPSFRPIRGGRFSRSGRARSQIVGS
jgi:hypothetical protein